ncbi:uncharacterized protein UTRI_02370 [Ustilago trichophora]|uniref:Uncharacterized protein n=1 Tax=Ustilago trichophora TaxID=86804 RepID=A0A5C3E927_9BASI|nr:uncharacterized protein UTRI_02370 [Ustilago trichophora]
MDYFKSLSSAASSVLLRLDQVLFPTLPSAKRSPSTASRLSGRSIPQPSATTTLHVLAQSQDKRATLQRQDWIVWGLSSIVNAVKFLNVDAASTHGNLRPDPSSSAPQESGSSAASTFDPPCRITAWPSFQPRLFDTRWKPIRPPEVKQNGWNVLANMDSTLLDSYSLALVAIEAFNAHVGANAKTRNPWPGYGRRRGRRWIFQGEHLVKVARGLDGFLLATDNEKASIIKLLQEKPDSFTPDFLMYKVLPALVAALAAVPPPGTIPSASTQASVLLPLPLHLRIDPHAWPSRNLSLYAERMDNRVVCDKLWPNLITGFNDSVPVIREATLKAILPLAPSSRTAFSTTTCFASLPEHRSIPEAASAPTQPSSSVDLSRTFCIYTQEGAHSSVLAQSQGSIRARSGGRSMALMATGDSFDHEDCAKQCYQQWHLHGGQEKLVRDQADKAMKMFLEKVESGRAGMPDTRSNRLAGWAMSSALSSLSNSSSAPSVPDGKPLSSAAELQSQMDGRSTPPPRSAHPPRHPSRHPNRKVYRLRQVWPAFARLWIGSGGLGGDNVPGSWSHDSSSTAKSPLDYDLDDDATSASTASAFQMQPDQDLMDVHDDSADWSSFEVGQPKKKAPTVGRTKMAKAKLGPRRTAATNAASAAAAAARATPPPVRADPKQAITRSSLAVAAPSKNPGAKMLGCHYHNESTPNHPASQSMSTSLSPLRLFAMTCRPARATAQAFETPVPKAIANSGSVTPTPSKRVGPTLTTNGRRERGEE